MLLLLMQWGDRHLAERPPLVIEHSCNADLEPVVVCRACGEPAVAGISGARFQTPGWTAAGAKE